MFDLYLDHSKVYKTYPTYMYEKSGIKSLKRCFEFLNIKDTSNLNPRTIDKIIRYYQVETECKSISINHNIGILKRVAKFSKIENKYLMELRKLKVIKKHFPIFTENQLKQIFKYVNDLDGSINSFTYRVLVYMLLDTGARINELLNIKISNISFKERHIYLEITKNNKPRYVLFTHLSSHLVKQLIEQNLEKSEFLFYNELRKRPMNYSDSKLFMRRMQEKLKIEKLHAHMFRRTFATKLHENGASLASIQVLLGHETIEMTRNYIDVSMEKVKKDYDTYFSSIIV